MCMSCMRQAKPNECQSHGTLPCNDGKVLSLVLRILLLHYSDIFTMSVHIIFLTT